MLVGPAAELASVVGEDGFDGDLVGLEEGQDVVVEEMDGGERHFGGVEACEGDTGVAVDGGLGVDASDALEMSDVEGVDGKQRAGVGGIDVTFAELGIEAFKESDLLVGELDGSLARVLLEADEALVFGEEVVTFPDASDATGGDVDFAQGEFLGDAKAAVCGPVEAVLEDCVLDLLGESVGMGVSGARKPVDEAFGAEGLKVAADLVELLSGVSHELAGLGYIVEFVGQFEQAELASGDLDFSGHVGVLVWFWWYKTPTRTTWPLSASEASKCQVNTVTAQQELDYGLRLLSPHFGNPTPRYLQCLLM